MKIMIFSSFQSSFQEEFASVVARVESMRSRQAEGERHPVCDGAGVNGLSPMLRFGDASRFESMLAEAFKGN